MFRVVENGRVQTVDSLEELARWLQRGKLSEHTMLIDVDSGEQKPVYLWLTGNQSRRESGPDQDFDYQAELERKLNELKRREPGSFSDDEILAMKRFLRYLVKHDLDRELDPDMLADFRKTLRRTSAAQLQDSQAVTVPIQQMLRPGQSASPTRDPRAGQSQVTYSKTAYTGNLAYRTLPGTETSQSGQNQPQKQRSRQRQTPKTQAPPQKGGWFGRLLVRMAILFGVLSWLVNSGKLDIDFDSIVQEFLPHPVITVGSGFDQTQWKPESLTDTFDVGQDITYTVTHVTCAQPTLHDEVMVQVDGKSEELLNRDTEWLPDHDQFMGRVTASRLGVYEITIRCGDEVIAQTKAYVTE